MNWNANPQAGGAMPVQNNQPQQNQPIQSQLLGGQKDSWETVISSERYPSLVLGDTVGAKNTGNSIVNVGAGEELIAQIIGATHFDSEEGPVGQKYTVRKTALELLILQTVINNQLVNGRYTLFMGGAKRDSLLNSQSAINDLVWMQYAGSGRGKNGMYHKLEMRYQKGQQRGKIIEDTQAQTEAPAQPQNQFAPQPNNNPPVQPQNQFAPQPNNNPPVQPQNQFAPQPNNNPPVQPQNQFAPQPNNNPPVQPQNQFAPQPNNNPPAQPENPPVNNPFIPSI